MCKARVERTKKKPRTVISLESEVRVYHCIISSKQNFLKLKFKI